MTTITRDMIEARLLLPILNFSLACISEQDGQIAHMKTALVDEVERLVRDAQAGYRVASKAKGAYARAAALTPEERKAIGRKGAAARWKQGGDC